MAWYMQAVLRLRGMCRLYQDQVVCACKVLCTFQAVHRLYWQAPLILMVRVLRLRRIHRLYSDYVVYAGSTKTTC